MLVSCALPAFAERSAILIRGRTAERVVLATLPLSVNELPGAAVDGGAPIELSFTRAFEVAASAAAGTVSAKPTATKPPRRRAWGMGTFLLDLRRVQRRIVIARRASAERLPVSSRAWTSTVKRPRVIDSRAP